MELPRLTISLICVDDMSISVDAIRRKVLPDGVLKTPGLSVLLAPTDRLRRNDSSFSAL